MPVPELETHHLVEGYDVQAAFAGGDTTVRRSHAVDDLGRPVEHGPGRSYAPRRWLGRRRSRGLSTADAAATAEAGRQDATSNPQLLIASLFIFVLAGFVGFEVIGRVSPLLHTPLMSATNAISGISLVGSLVIAGNEQRKFSSHAATMLGLLAVTAAMINVVGGFMITDRMLKMFKKKEGGR